MASCHIEPLVSFCRFLLAAKVTTATTAGSFYANCVSVLIVVKQFGFFMGTEAA